LVGESIAREGRLTAVDRDLNLGIGRGEKEGE